jgi:carboxypeptidase family protein/TonB-dependent receptor-like protein
MSMFSGGVLRAARMSNGLRFAAVVVLVSGLLAGSVKAQDVASITGTVVDKTGGAVSDADVKLLDTRTGAVYVSQTGSFGAYLFSRVPAGPGYTLTVSKAGFKTATTSNLTLAVTETATYDVALELGNVSQTVEVNANGGATLNTTDATIGNDIDTRQVAELPSLFRTNAAALLTLAPGVIAASDSGGEADSQLGSVTGSRADQGNITLDGLDVNDETIGQAFTAVGSAPIDSIDEVHTTVGEPGAAFGRSSGGQINLVTKSGSNNFHGSLHEYNRNTIFAANDFFNNKAGIGRQPVNRNQFGVSIGGPIFKDKLFFFVNYEGRRDAISTQVEQIVPNDTFRSGQLNYVDVSGNVQTTTTTQLQTIDPQGTGANAAFLAFINSRYPAGNDPALGDGLNTTGLLFNTPTHIRDNIYTGRLDYVLTAKHKLFARLQRDRFTDDDSNNVLPQFPSDPHPQISDIDHDRSFVVGETWLVTKNLVNQVYAGLTRQVFATPVNFAPTAPFIFTTSLVSNPFADIRGQSRDVGVPEIRDDLSYQLGNHALSFGTDIKPIRVHSTNQADVNFLSIGIDGGSSLNALDPSTRPTDMSDDPAAQAEWDRAFTLLLGRYNQTASNFAYDKAGNPLPPYSLTHRDFHYNEYELYAQDSWRIRRDLTLTYGLRWQYHSVPFEANGLQSVSNQNIDTIFPARLAAAAQGISGNDAAPLVSYDLGGPANHAPGYYKPSYRDFGPRLGIAYSPSFTNGLLGAVFGDRKTTIRAGGAIVYDRVLSTLGFELDEQTFLFDSNPILNYGGSDPTMALLTSPRFTSLSAPPPLPAVPAVTPRPITPNLDSTGAPVGLANGGFPSFLQFDKNFKTPYADTFSFGVQRELKGNLIVEVDYFGRLGRRLTADGDAGQTLNFKDVGSGQLLKDAFGKLQAQVQTGAPITSQPWFENQLQSATGASCPVINAFFGLPYTTCSEFVGNGLSNFVGVGDLSSTILVLSQIGVLNPNTALYAQTGANGYIGNYSSSSYNAMLLSVRKRYSNNLNLDFDYSYSHSIDNQSNITNNLNQFTGTGQGLICDLTNLRTCRADSLFDARHNISANYVYDLPVGRGQRFLGSTSGWVNMIVGGWSTSGIVRYRTGFPFTTHTGTFPINFTQDAPAVFNGDRQAVRQGIHTDPATGAIQFFADQNAAFGAFGFPFGGDTGTRNPVHGPDFMNVDIAVAKNFTMPWSDHHKLQFRWEAFNAFNHVDFAAPGDPTSITDSNNILLNPAAFGVITATAHSPRQMQFSLRYDF